MRSLLHIVTGLASIALAQDVDYSQYVNPFMGSTGPYAPLAFGGGDIFVGAAVPFGVSKVGIDTYETNLSFATINGGYTPAGLVTGISMMHESGTGGPPKYGIISQMPLTTLDGVNVLDNTTYWQNRTVSRDTALVGYYSTKLTNGVQFELSAGRHSGIISYDFPAGEAHILVDVSHYLPNPTASTGEGQFYSGGQIDLQPGGRIYTGYGSYGGGFSNSAPLTTYFCGEFETEPDTAQTFKGRNTDPLVRLRTLANEPPAVPTYGNLTETSGPLNDRVGALFSWNNAGNATVKSRIGISFISADNACALKNQEMTSWDVEDIRQAAVQEWNDDIFSKIRVSTDSTQNETNLALLYSSLYFMHLMPSDRTGQNPLWPNTTPHWDDFYTLWDIFRCTISLYNIIVPAYFGSMVQGIIDIWKWEGYMPDGRSGEYSGLVQGGSNADNVLADAYIKKVAGINWTEAYQAMTKDAEVAPYNSFMPIDTTGSIQIGRGALTDWIELGYLAVDHNSRSISRAMEYSLNDFSLYTLAKDLAPADAPKYLHRSAQWQNQWAHDLVHKTFTGFMAPKLSTGGFNLTDYNPALCGGCEWTSITYEGTPFEYSFTVPHDMETLIQFMGGEAEFERRLDYIFVPNTSEQNLGANGAGITTIMNIGNEPDFATPYEYNYINKQYKSVNQSRSLANEFFHNADYGVPGNSDAGALNSWLIWQMLGLYPVVTQPVYLIESPWFDDINITVNYNHTLRITATGLNNQNSYFVQSVIVNGQAWTQNWLEHGDVMVNGGTIEFQLGSEMTAWETGPVPPSPGHIVLTNASTGQLG